MSSIYSFHIIPHPHKELTELKEACLAQFTSPPDGMWEAFRDRAKHWGIKKADEWIAYACQDEQGRLIQCYISPDQLSAGEDIFGELLRLADISEAIVGTNNPIFLSLALSRQRFLKVHTYLFRTRHEVQLEQKRGSLSMCQPTDLTRMVDFCHDSLGAPKEWLKDYLGELIERREVFVLEGGGEIIGSCEVRKSNSAPSYADIGMIVSPKFRQQGYGSYLLNKAAEIALKRGQTPICSCEKDNLGSWKAIHRCGFVSTYQLLAIQY